MGLAIVVEVVDVAPLRRNFLACRLLLGVLPDQGQLADAGRAQREYVVALAAHAHAEGQRIHGAVLAEYAGQLVGPGGGLEPELVRVAGRPELGRSQWIACHDKRSRSVLPQ